MKHVIHHIRLRWIVLFTSVALVAAPVMLPTPVEAASSGIVASCLPVSSQNYDLAVEQSSGFGQTVAQFFTAAASGTVNSVQLALGTSATQDLTVQFATVSDGQPVVTSATPYAQVSPSDASENPLTTITTFSTPVSVVAGQTYALVFSTASNGNWNIYNAENGCAGDAIEVSHGESYASAPNNPAAFTVSVVVVVPVTGITLNHATLSLTVGGAEGQLQPTVSPADATNLGVTWTSSDPNVATVTSSGTVTPVAAGTATITATTVDGGYTASSTVTVAAAPGIAPPVPSWTPPLLGLESMPVSGISGTVIGTMGYNAASAVQSGTYGGYVAERTALGAGATASGEGINSSYLSAILDGSGVGLQQHVSAVQQGQFAALYQKLGIIPTWTDNTVSVPDGVSALIKAGAAPLAIENYLVQLDGFSWAAAMAQAQAGFPIRAAT